VNQLERCPTPRRVTKRSAQTTKPKEPAIEVQWGENLGFLEGTQGESARGAAQNQGESSRGVPNQQNPKSQ
jgi:hypothetical protein